MVKLGNFIFKYRNSLFPLLFFLLAFIGRPYLGSKYFEYVNYVIGVTVALAGQIVRALTIGLAYIKRGGKNKKIYADGLVKEGMFAHCRNPLYLGNILIVTGLGIVSNSFLFVVIGIPLFIFFYMAIIMAEENYLSNKFGEEYVEYCRNVNRFIPNFSGIGTTLKNMTFNWKRLLTKEYGTTYLWIVCMIILIERNQYIRYGNQENRTVIVILGLSLIVVTALYAIARNFKKSHLTESEERLRRRFETLKDGILMLDRQTGNVINVNPVIEKLLGYSQNEIVGKNVKEIGLLKDIEDVREIFRELYKVGFIHYYGIPLENKIGQKIYTEIYLINRADAIQCTIRNITERILAEEENKKRFKELEDFYEKAVGRELRIKQLEEENEKIKEELEKYKKS
jgi:PAS domain S-box-containing protein